jgi:hypothetical protein
MAATSQNPSRFTQSNLVGSHISKTKCYGYNVEQSVPERQRQSVGYDQFRDTTPARNVQHWCAKIRPDDSRRRGLALEFLSQNTASCGEIQNGGGVPTSDHSTYLQSPKRITAQAQNGVCEVVSMRDPAKQALNRTRFLLRKGGFHAPNRLTQWDECSREDSNLHGLPHTVLSRTRLPVPPREQGRCEAIGELPVVKHFDGRGSRVAQPLLQTEQATKSQSTSESPNYYAVTSDRDHSTLPWSPCSPRLCGKPFPSVPSSAQAHRHQNIEKWPGDFDDSRAHLVDEIQIDFVVCQVPKGRHEKFRVECD